MGNSKNYRIGIHPPQFGREESGDLEIMRAGGGPQITIEDRYQELPPS
jgi:hypothetical protein